MNVVCNKIETNKMEITITVPKDVWAKGLDIAFEKVSKKVSVPGFRKGKIPRTMFEKKYGVESLYDDALNAVLPEVYTQALDTEGIEPVSYPEWDIKEIGNGVDVVAVATVTVKPEVKLGDYKGLKVEALSTEVTEDDIKAEIDELLKSNAEMVVKDGAVENGDTAVIDYEGFNDGVAFEGGKGENHSLEIGSNSFIPGFEEQVIGMNVGDEKDINVTFPEQYHSEELAGAPVVFKVKLHEVKARQLPELDDEFVKDLDREEIETVDALKSDINEKLTQSKKDAAENHVASSVIEQAVENAEFEIPEIMFENEVDRMVQELEQRYQSQGVSLDIYLQFTGSDMEGLRAQLLEQATERVSQTLVIEAIVKAESMDVSEVELDEELTKMAEMYQMEIADLKKMIPDTDMVKKDIQTRKTIDMMIESSVVA